MLRYLLIFWAYVGVGCSLAHAQQGNYLLRNLTQGQATQLGQVYALEELQDGRLVIGSTEGVALFDGQHWEQVETPSEVRSLALGKDSVIYVGCFRSKAVYLAPDPEDYGRLQALPIPGFSRYEQFGTIEHVFAENSGSILFLGSRHLLRYEPKTEKLTELINPREAHFFGGFQHTDGSVYVNLGGKGLMKIEGEKLLPTPEGYRFNNEWERNRNLDMTIRFGTPYSVEGKTYSLIGTASGRLFYFDGKDLTMFQTAGTAERLKTAGLHAALQVSPNLLALGTATSGVWLVRPGTLEELQRINVRSGLPDNQIRALRQGPNNGLWIAHDQGLSRVSVGFPITDVGVYQGLEGSPTAATKFQGTLFIGTSSGVFRGEQQTLSNSRATELKLQAREMAEAEIDDEIEAETLRRLSRLGKTKERNRISYESILKDVKKEFTRDREQWLKERTQLYLRELSAEGEQNVRFSRVRGVTGRVNQFINILDQLIVVTTAGVFQVSEEDSRLIFDKGSVNRAYPVDNDSLILIAGDLGIFTLKYTLAEETGRKARGKKREPSYSWETKALGIGLSENFLEVAEEDDGTIWVSGDASQIVQLPPLDGYGELSRGLTAKDKKILLEDYAREIQVRRLHGRVRFISRRGVYRLSSRGDSFELDPAFSRFKERAYFADSPFGMVWVAVGDQLFRIRFSDSDPAAILKEIERLKSDATNQKLPADELERRARKLLALNDRIIAIDTFHASRSLEATIAAVYPSDESEDVAWLVIGQHLYRFDANTRGFLPRTFTAYFRAIYSNQDTTYSPTKRLLEIQRGVTDLTFQLGAASYVVDGGIRFEYRYDNDPEGTWQTLPAGVDILQHRDLSAGQHTLTIRAVDVFGNISREASYSFRVPIPWYREYWRELLGFGFAGLVVVGLLGFFWQRRLARKKEMKLEADKAFYRRSTRVLLDNILPPKIARDLEQRIDHELETAPDNFSIENLEKPPMETFVRASVLFTDFKGFTSVASKLSPQEVSDLLNENFLAFDRIAKRNRLEKIKTIGDAYMAGGGLPDANSTNPVDAVLAGLQIQAYMRGWAARRETQGLPAWHCRVGVNTGELIAGIIGNYKFAYDCWGDTVNTASRMESNGEIHKVNVSGETYELIKDLFDCSPRGALLVKNKGEVVQYFVEGIRPGLHKEGDPTEPNEVFWLEVNKKLPPLPTQNHNGGQTDSPTDKKEPKLSFGRKSKSTKQTTPTD